MIFRDLIETSHAMSRSKGWHDEDAPKATLQDRCMLVITELAETMEELRNSKPITLIYFNMPPVSWSMPAVDYAADGHKPEGIPIEIADAVIRIGDLSGAHKIPYTATELDMEIEKLDEWVGTDPAIRRLWERADTLGGWLLLTSSFVAQAALREVWTRHSSYDLVCALATLVRLSKESEFSLGHAIKIKQAYNATRPHRHGGKLL